MREPLINTGPEGANPEPRKTGYRPLDLLLAGSAILISTISLIVGFQNAATQERMVAATSRPILFFETGNSSGDRPVITLTIRNDGAGPALLRYLDVRYAGRPIANKVELFKACCDLDMRTPENRIPLMSRRIADTILPMNAESTFLTVPKSVTSAAVWERLDQERFKLTFDACYCSIIGECWRSDLTGREPKRVKQCPTTGGWRDI